MKRSYASAVFGSVGTVIPNGTSLFAKAGEAIDSLRALLSVAITIEGVPRGANKPTNASCSKSLYPDSVIVGTSGRLARRLPLAIANRRTLPLVTIPATLGNQTNPP